MSNDKKCELLTSGYIRLAFNSFLPKDIYFICIDFMIGKNIKLVYCDDNTGEIDLENVTMKRLPTDAALRYIAKQIEDEMYGKEYNNKFPRIHIWLKFGEIADKIYPINKKVKVTMDDLKNEDHERLIEIPDDYLSIKLNEIKFDKEPLIVIEKSNPRNTGNKIWPMAKQNCDNLKVGDILDVKDEQDRWYETVIRFVDDKNDNIIIHYIGWNAKWDESLSISNNKTRIASRHQHSTGPYRGRWVYLNGASHQRGVVGLDQGYEQTSFINATLQCLAQSPQLTVFFLKNDFIHFINVENPDGYKGELAKVYGQLLKQMFGDLLLIIHSHAFITVLYKITTQFKQNYSEYDAETFLSFLLEGLHQDLNQMERDPKWENIECDEGSDEIIAAKTWKNYLQGNTSKIIDMIYGQYKTSIKCSHCNDVKIEFVCYKLLSLPTLFDSNSIDIANCIKSFCEEQTEDGVCSKCAKHTSFKRKKELYNAPDLMIVHLKRSKYRESKKGLIRFPLNGLDLGPYLLDCTHKMDSVYDCFAVLNYIESDYMDNYGGGGYHYTAYTKNLYNHKWYYFNDRDASLVYNMNDIISNNAYILFYYRRNPKHAKHRTSRVKIPLSNGQ